MKQFLLCIFLLASISYTATGQEKKSKKQLKLEKKKIKFENSKKAMEAGEFTFGIRRIATTNVGGTNFGGGNLYVRNTQGELFDFTWFDTDGKRLTLSSDFGIQNYLAFSSNNGNTMTSSFKGRSNGKTYTFKVIISFGEKPTLWMSSSDGVEAQFQGLFETRN